jgi:hypothetical protein
MAKKKAKKEKWMAENPGMGQSYNPVCWSDRALTIYSTISTRSTEAGPEAIEDERASRAVLQKGCEEERGGGGEAGGWGLVGWGLVGKGEGVEGAEGEGKRLRARYLICYVWLLSSLFAYCPLHRKFFSAYAHNSSTLFL